MERRLLKAVANTSAPCGRPQLVPAGSWWNPAGAVTHCLSSVRRYTGAAGS
eukprot:CAMPEP_0206139294 /NCGR_PEP_ID=MMETSP1473-20131121/5515_1 /ASSEMBLY_ACC=CAM_ASM_001109 /TAXON_ID=1461547 /ORGANISM="Stichococcus sp, Strain RCC1054" /LENGTH=50 /DNA_ID=CAMNT_0053533031 /DNA_START=129 /DNA_END=278 /DNA_ORIENTATION=-